MTRAAQVIMPFCLIVDLSKSLSEPVNIAVIGEFSCGKSSLLNALVEARHLCEAVVCRPRPSLTAATLRPRLWEAVADGALYCRPWGRASFEWQAYLSLATLSRLLGLTAPDAYDPGNKTGPEQELLPGSGSGLGCWRYELGAGSDRTDWAVVRVLSFLYRCEDTALSRGADEKEPARTSPDGRCTSSGGPAEETWYEAAGGTMLSALEVAAAIVIVLDIAGVLLGWSLVFISVRRTGPHGRQADRSVSAARLLRAAMGLFGRHSTAGRPPGQGWELPTGSTALGHARALYPAAAVGGCCKVPSFRSRRKRRRPLRTGEQSPASSLCSREIPRIPPECPRIRSQASRRHGSPLREQVPVHCAARQGRTGRHLMQERRPEPSRVGRALPATRDALGSPSRLSKVAQFYPDPGLLAAV